MHATIIFMLQLFFVGKEERGGYHSLVVSLHMPEGSVWTQDCLSFPLLKVDQDFRLDLIQIILPICSYEQSASGET